MHLLQAGGGPARFGQGLVGDVAAVLHAVKVNILNGRVSR